MSVFRAGQTGSLLPVTTEPTFVLSFELHCHSERSHDGVDSVPSLLKAAADAGLDGLVVTDHDAIEASKTAVKVAPEYDLLAIPGIEISSSDGHVLALGVDQLVPAGEPFVETVAMIHSQGGVAVVPHPYQRLRKGVLANVPEEELTVADAIEVYNSRFLTGWTNRKAQRLAERLEMPQTAGSDAHVSEMVGRAVTKINAEPTVESVLDAIRSGRTTVKGQRTPLPITVRQASGTARRRLRKKLTSSQ